MNKTILKQALLFKDTNPTLSKIKNLYEEARIYQAEAQNNFLYAKRREKSKIIDMELFFEFLSDLEGVEIVDFAHIENMLNATTRAENILYSGDSKSTIVKIFNMVVVVKKMGEIIQLYKENELENLKDIESFVAVENGETFLNIEHIAHHFKYKNFIYLSGYANSLTREFLKSKKVEFFVDYDIEGMNIYESFTCRDKSLHVAQDLERYFKDKKYNSVELYKNQRDRFRTNYSDESMQIIELIKKHSTVVEQEIIYETH